MIAALQAIAAGALIVVALALGVATLLRVKPPTRRADDPAADPRAEPYGECPGFPRETLEQFDVARLRRAERGAGR
ncbi:hypothetical protein LPW26_03405 [Rhodopseudomonas sp. HC1]|uniref:hypothetical protein n=1 Tax=Rhodopseudomonas infernalis TaxID=2897386 RepID=UPI001EE8045B|nr:hypothetical protein [Rhodopseudomonas infernalis]MCG6203673.1 hypothetical protein [Rhodopseudomonas infernalis]